MSLFETLSQATKPGNAIIPESDVIRTVKFYGESYDIKKVGIDTKTIKPHYDFNGYWNNGGVCKKVRYGMFQDGLLVYKLGGHNGKQVLSKVTGKSIGAVSFDIPEGSYQFIENK